MPSILRLALPALAVSGFAAAQCSNSATATIQNAGDATALASCSTYSGSIAIATGVADDISIGGIKELKGNLVIDGNSNIKRLGASELETLSGELTLNGLTRLASIDFPKLKKVDSIKWNALPNLQQIGFTATVEQAKKVRIENTGLRSLSGINLQQIQTIFIANNGYINDITMQLGNVSDALDFVDNNKALKVELTNLIWATNLTFRSCGSVAVPSLMKLNGSLGLYNNAFESFAAPNLTTIGGVLAVVGNDAMTNLSFPLLTKVSDNLQIANNSALLEVDGFPQLKSVGGGWDVSGNMSKVASPKLESVKGTFNVQSSDNLTESCNFYQNLKNKKYIEGGYVCRGKLVDPGTQGHKPKDQAGNKQNAAATLSGINGALGLAAMVAVFLI